MLQYFQAESRLVRLIDRFPIFKMLPRHQFINRSHRSTKTLIRKTGTSAYFS